MMLVLVSGREGIANANTEGPAPPPQRWLREVEVAREVDGHIMSKHPTNSGWESWEARYSLSP